MLRVRVVPCRFSVSLQFVGMGEASSLGNFKNLDLVSDLNP